jgi:hypothetical protein
MTGGRATVRPTRRLSRRRSRRRIKRRLRAHTYRVLHAPFPLFGLPESWLGRRWVGTMSSTPHRWRRDAVRSIGLSHTPPRVQKTPCLVVQSEVPNGLDSGTDLQLVGSALLRRGVGSLDAAIAHVKERGFEIADDTERPVESTVGFRIDGVETEFRLLSRSDQWVAFHARDDVFISVIGYRFDLSEVELVTISDPGPYLEMAAFQLRAVRSRRA